MKYHPDKQTGDQKLDENDPIFLAIQKAYDTLGDEKKRRSYDSQFEFDESIPGPSISGDFFKTFGPVFIRNARFSEVKPVPLLGTKSTGMDEVYAFYDFWARFKSWRDFSQSDEHDESTAECREEKRWMQVLSFLNTILYNSTKLLSLSASK